MRRPFYWSARNAWYIRQPTTDNKLRTIYLADDEAEAHRIWQETFKPKPREFNPATVEGVILAQESLKPAVATIESHSPAKRSTVTVERSQATKTTTAPAVLLKATKPAKDPNRTGSARTLRRQRPKHEPGSIESRLMQVARVLLVAECLAPLRRGASIRDLASDVSELLGQAFHPRTIHRDVMLLESLGVVTCETETPSRGGKPSVRARWIAGSIRAAIVERMAGISGERFASD